MQSVIQRARELFAVLSDLSEVARIDAINEIRLALHEHSPFRAEPVDCVLWVLAENVEANDYNPNTVAPPEMALLRHSIAEDGYTQPVVTWIEETDGVTRREVVDGFHRCRVGKECKEVAARVRGYLPVTTVNTERVDRGDRIAATIRHNRARGKHRVDAMSDIVIELKRRNWSDKKIGKDLGMDPDEVLRLSQIAGLAEMFKDREFSEAWEAEGSGDTGKIDEDDDLNTEGEEESSTNDAGKKKTYERDVDGWEHRTDSRSELNASVRGVAARLNRAPGATRWRWTVYVTPIQTGLVDSKEAAKEAADRWISESSS